MIKIFVFGSNTKGIHGKGAAKYALDYYGAEYGNSRGRQGNSYAIVTKDLTLGKRSIPLLSIEKDVREFLSYAANNQELWFDVTPIGCGLAGYTPEEIAPMFKGAPLNVSLPSEFLLILDDH